MEEFKKERIENCSKEEVCIEMTDVSFSWGVEAKNDKDIKQK